MTTVDSRALVDRFPGLPKSPAECITCGGTKVFRFYAQGRAAADKNLVEYDCNCADQFILHRVLLHSGVKEHYQRLGWADLTGVSESAQQAVSTYLDNFDAYTKAGMGLILQGPVGTGKTLVAYLLVKELVGKGLDCYATTFADMIETFTSGWRDKDEKVWFQRRVRDAQVLLIDDLGRERNKGLGSVGESMLEEVVRHRVGRDAPTFITTNPALDQITNAYGGHTYSLLSESAKAILFTGEDWRRGRATQRLDFEITHGISRPVMIG